MYKDLLHLNTPHIMNKDNNTREIIELINDSEDFEIKSNYQEITLINDKNTKEINIKVLENSNVVITSLINLNNNFNINISLESNSNIELYLGDIASSNSNITINSDLNKENSSSNIFIASFAGKDNYKKYSVNSIHNSKFSNSKIKFNGVSKENGNIKVDAISHIKENASKSNASQDIRITLIDEASKGRGYPILKIDNNDIKANHGCAIGNVKEADLYYILSRGINKEDAKRLITLGYLIPITSKMDEESKNIFINYIGEKL